MSNPIPSLQSEPENTNRGFAFPMDPESNWDICPVCIGYLHTLAEFPGVETMRSHHAAHKANS